MILFSRFWGENISGLFKTSQVLNSSFKCVDKLYIFNALMIVNNIITTIMGVKGKVNTVMKLTEDCIMCYLYTRIQKTYD